MTAPTLTLADFLLQRIAEDEAAARSATQGRWTWDEPQYQTRWVLWAVDGEPNPPSPPGVRPSPGAEVLEASYDDSGVEGSDADKNHIARWDPARVLAECEAKRRIVEWHGAWPVLVEQPPQFEQSASDDPSRMVYRMSQQIAWTTEREYRTRFGSEPPTGPILRLLALPYADHPDYREIWRP